MNNLETVLQNHSAAWSRRMTAIPVVSRWLCEQLVRALLGGAWQQVCKREGTAYDRAFHRFCWLVNATPCWPCLIQFEPHGPLWILTGQAAEDVRKQEEEISWQEAFA